MQKIFAKKDECHLDSIAWRRTERDLTHGRGGGQRRVGSGRGGGLTSDGVQVEQHLGHHDAGVHQHEHAQHHLQRVTLQQLAQTRAAPAHTTQTQTR